MIINMNVRVGVVFKVNAENQKKSALLVAKITKNVHILIVVEMDIV